MKKGRKLLLLLATGIMVSAFSFPMTEAKEKVGIASVSNAEREEEDEIVSKMPELTEEIQETAAFAVQEGNEFAAIEDLELNIIYPEKKEITVGELPRSIRLFVFGDGYLYNLGNGENSNTRETLLQLKMQLRGIDTDVYFLDVENRDKQVISEGRDTHCTLCEDRNGTYRNVAEQLFGSDSFTIPAVFVVGKENETIFLKTFAQETDTAETFVQDIKNSIFELYPEEEVNEQGQVIVHADTAEKFLKALQSDTKIILEGKTYNVSRQEIYYAGDEEAVFNESEIELSDIENLTIQGQEGTRIVSNSGSDLIFDLYNCSIVLDNLVIGHDLPQRPSYGCDIDIGVILSSASDITINNCDIFGCGWYGIRGQNTSYTVVNSKIRDCSSHIMEISITEDDVQCVFRNCQFYGNGYAKPFIAAINYSTIRGFDIDKGDAEKLIFEDCEFNNNSNPNFCGAINGYWEFEEDDGNDEFIMMADPIFFEPTVRNCTFSDNGWDAKEDSPKLINSITIAPSEITLKAGDKETLSKTIVPEDADNLSVTWHSTNIDVATVDDQGVVTAISDGTAEVYCTAQDAGKAESNRCKVTVQSGADTPGNGEENPVNPNEPGKKRVESITITPAEITMNVGSRTTLSKETVPAEGLENPSVTWHSTNASVAAVDDQGTITAIAKGEAEIYCVSQDGGNVESNHCKVRVIAPSGGGSSGGSGGGGGGSARSSRSDRTSDSSSTSLPSYVVKGTWKQAEDGTWRFTDSAGKVYANVWAAVQNPYANPSAGQQAFDWFRFNENGDMLIGWYYDAAEGFWYYLNPISDNTLGKMITGWVVIDGYYYYFNEKSDGHKGRMYRDEITPDGYQVDKNGVWIINGIPQAQ